MRLFGHGAPRVDEDGQRHADAYVRPRLAELALRFPDGEPTGFALDARRLAFRDGRGVDGCLRLDFHELLDSPAGSLAFHRGGAGYADAQNVKYGHVALDELLHPPRQPEPSGGHRGEPVELDGAPLVVRVRSIPRAMHYKRPQDPPVGHSKRGARWLHYGDPGADQGERHDIHYSYLCWSWLDARGGGMVRALLREGMTFLPAAVEPIRRPAWDEAGRENGEVVGVYGAIELPGGRLFGWAARSHRYDCDDRGETVAHLARARRAAQPSRPTWRRIETESE